MQYFLQNVQNEIFEILKKSKYNAKFTRTACQINSKVRNRQKHQTHDIFILPLLLVMILIEFLKFFSSRCNY